MIYNFLRDALRLVWHFRPAAYVDMKRPLPEKGPEQQHIPREVLLEVRIVRGRVTISEVAVAAVGVQRPRPLPLPAAAILDPESSTPRLFPLGQTIEARATCRLGVKLGEVPVWLQHHRLPPDHEVRLIVADRLADKDYPAKQTFRLA